jgi:uncharacterized membrane protein YfcA
MSIIADPIFYAFAIPAVFTLGISKGGFSGVGMIAAPLLAMIVPPLQGAAILLPLLITQDIISVWVYRRDWDAWNLKVLVPGGVIGTGIAWALAAHVSDAAVRLAIGVIGVAFVLSIWLGPTGAAPRRPSAAGGVFWGVIAGFTSTLSQAGAPPVQMHVLPQRLPKLTLVGTYTIYFAILNLLKIVPYFQLGQFSSENFMTSVVLFPLAVASNFLGIWLVRRTPTELFYRIAYVLMLLISLELVRSGALGIWRG